MIVKAMIS